jgi:hypothetical protein
MSVTSWTPPVYSTSGHVIELLDQIQRTPNVRIVFTNIIQLYFQHVKGHGRVKLFYSTSANSIILHCYGV